MFEIKLNSEYEKHCHYRDIEWKEIDVAQGKTAPAVEEKTTKNRRQTVNVTGLGFPSMIDAAEKNPSGETDLSNFKADDKVKKTAIT